MSEQVVVNNASSVPNVVGTLLRYAGSAIGGYAVAKGWIMAENAVMVAGVVVTVGTALWGAILAHLNKKKLVSIASDPRVPDSVAMVK